MKKKKQPVKSKSFSATEFCASLTASIAKDIGEGNILTDTSASRIKFFSSGLFGLDSIINNGKGYPRAKIIEVFGPESSGKSHLLYAYAKYVQSRGKIAVILDLENRYSMEYIYEEIGLVPSLSIIVKPTNIEDFFDKIIKEDWISDSRIGVIGIDSIAAVVTEQEKKGELSDANIGAQARLITRFVTRVKDVMTNREGPTLFVVNQVRDNIGGYVDKTPGGRALKFYGCLRMAIKRSGSIESKGKHIGMESKIMIMKSSVGAPRGEYEASLIFGKGYCNFNEFSEVVETKNGKFVFHLNDKSMSMGKSELKEWLFNHPKESHKIWKNLKYPKNVTADTSSEVTAKSQEREENEDAPPF